MTHLRSIALRGWRPLILLACVAALATACGGGGADGGEGGVGGGGTGAPASFSQGPITGFGSIIVNGVHFDDSAATVVDDDGNALSNATSLRLGSVVDVQGGAIADGSARATAITVHIDLLGPVTTAFNASTGRLGVLGQPVQVLASTALDGFAGGAAAIHAGQVVAVSSLYDKASGVYVATRIDPVAGATRFAIRGAPTAVDATAGTFSIGGQSFGDAGTMPPSGFAVGQLVRVLLGTAIDSHGRWVVATFGQALDTLPSGRFGSVDGVVTSATDATHFVAGGVNVDASRATLLPPGAAITVRSRVQVRGTITGSTLLAGSVVVSARDDDQDDDDPGGHGGPGGNGRFEIDGAILSLDPAHQVFTMRGPTTVSYASATFAGGKVTDLAAGARVEVRGDLSADGTEVIARQVRFGH